jgi:hypothetical protein
MITIFTLTFLSFFSSTYSVELLSCLQQNGGNSAYSICKFCNTDRFNYFVDPSELKDFCNKNSETNSNWSTTISTALISYGKIQGEFWANDAMALSSVEHLIKYMPIRDSVRLFSDNDRFFNFLLKNVRLALLVRTKSGAAWAKNTTLIPDDIFLDYVLPYSFLDEKRDVDFLWRERFYQLFMDTNVTSSSNVTEAMHYLASAIPTAHAAGVLSFDKNDLSLGSAVRWESETSPMRMSPAQVIQLGGGSCTGTAIVLAAAARSVGIPARVVGCSQSIPNDDHHWIEFYDPTSSSPFGNGWHTKEGTSAGNAGGPWDAPSEPMNGCLKYLVPKDKNRLNTIWSSSWSSSTYLPLQWSVGGGELDDARTQRLAFVGGVNKCGSYCTAWGCGMNQTSKFAQKDCDVPDVNVSMKK